MIEFKSQYIGIAKNLTDNKIVLHMEILEPQKIQQIDSELTGKGELTVTAKKYRKKRSLDANAYAWKLISEIADKVRESKEKVYVNMLKHYGQSAVYQTKAEVNIEGYFKYYEFIGSRITDKNIKLNYYRIFKGSSEYDSKEMSILIDGIIQEAENLEIQTMTPAELQVIKDAWGRKEKKV